MLDESGTFTLGVIGGGIPEGICGSGLVDLMSELLRTGRMNEMGRFDDGVERFTLDQARDLFFLESDVNELAQAKGANVDARVKAAVDVEAARVEAAAAALKAALAADAAAEAKVEIVKVGNAAIEGASIALLSVSARDALEGMVKRVEHCRLETHPDFFEFFVEGCQLKRVQSTDRVSR